MTVELSIVAIALGLPPTASADQIVAAVEAQNARIRSVDARIVELNRHLDEYRRGATHTGPA